MQMLLYAALPLFVGTVSVFAQVRSGQERGVGYCICRDRPGARR